MAMTLDTAIKFTAKLEGQGLDQLKRNLQGLSQQSNVSKRSLDQLYTATQKLGAASGNTIGGLQKYAASLRTLRDQAEYGSRSFRLLSRDLEMVEGKLRKFQGAASGQGGMAGGLSGGGIGSALAGLTAFFSGQKAVDLAGTAASFGSLQGQLLELNKAAGLTAQTAQVLANDGLGAVIKASRASGVPIENLSSQLLKLTAAAQGTIFQGAELNQVFIAINRYAAAFGVSVEDTDGIIRAFQQTLSKQKLSLEEINGQFGDRAPTALRVFAEAARMNVPEFTKAVADGKLTVNDLVDLLPALTKQAELLEGTMSPLKKAQKDLNAEMAQAGLIIGRTLEPAVTGITQTLAGFLKAFNEGNTGLVKGLAITAGAIAGIAAAWLAVAAAARTAAVVQGIAASIGKIPGPAWLKILGGLGGAAIGGTIAAQLFSGLDQEIENVKKQLEGITKMNLDKDFGQGTIAGGNQAAMEAAKKRLADELKIREDMELKLRDFRQQSLDRAMQLERDLAEERMRLERTVADNRKRLQQQAQDGQLLDQKMAARAAGLDTGEFDVRQRFADALRKFDQDRLDADQQYSDQKRQLDLKIEDYKISVAKGISNILQDAADKMAQKMVGGAQQAAGIISGTGGGDLTGRRAIPGSVGRGQLGVGNLVALARSAGFTGNNAAIMAAIAMAESGGRSGAHNNNPRTGDNSYGLWQINMLGGMGPQRRRAFGIGSNDALFDPAVNANAARQVFQSQGFGAWSVFRSGAYRQFLPAAQAAASNGSARMLIGRPGASSAVPGMDVIEQRRQEITGLMGTNRELRKQLSVGELVNESKRSRDEITAALDDQNKSLADQLRISQALTELQRSGLSPAVAQAKIDAEQAAVAEYRRLQAQREGLVQARERKGLSDQEREFIDAEIRAIDERIMKQPQITAQIVAQNQALERQREIQERNRQLAEGIAGAIGNGIGSAIDLLIDGTDNWGSSLRQIAAGVLKDIARQIAQTMVVAPIVKGITKAFGFADGGIMTADGPVPLRKYAGGGIANSPQLALFGEGSMPEAYVPLPDGRRIPVKMQGGGGATNVVVNVDASGSQVQGDAGRGEQLGRVISQAVQAELIKQRRPGGLLAA